MLLSSMNTYTIVPHSDGLGYDILIVSDNGVRQTILGFKTEADAEAWIDDDKKRDPGRAR